MVQYTQQKFVEEIKEIVRDPLHLPQIWKLNEKQETVMDGTVDHHLQDRGFVRIQIMVHSSSSISLKTNLASSCTIVD